MIKMEEIKIPRPKMRGKITWIHKPLYPGRPWHKSKSQFIHFKAGELRQPYPFDPTAIYPDTNAGVFPAQLWGS